MIRDEIQDAVEIHQEARLNMEDTSARMMKRDEKYFTGSDAWLSKFNRKYFPSTALFA